MGELTIPRTDLFIDGDWRTAIGEQVDEIVNPATEALLSTVRQGSTDDCEAALASARRAFDDGPWPAMSGAERGAYLDRFQAVLAIKFHAA